MAFRSSHPEPGARAVRNAPPEETHQEAAYLKMLGEKQCPVLVKLLDGSVFRGWIEYYDRRMVRLTRESEPNLFIFKHQIAYIAEDASRQKAPGKQASMRNGNSPSTAR
jgi:host factor-I protein